MSKLDVILEYYGRESWMSDKISFKEAKQAILKLIKEEVVPPEDEEWDYGNHRTWDACRQQMLDNLKKLE